MARHDYELGVRVDARRPHDFEAVHVPHAQIGDNDLVFFFGQQVNGFVSAVRGFGIVPPQLKHVADAVSRSGVIICDKHAPGVTAFSEFIIMIQYHDNESYQSGFGKLQKKFPDGSEFAASRPTIQIPTLQAHPDEDAHTKTSKRAQL